MSTENAISDILSTVLTHIQIDEAVKRIYLNPQFLDALIHPLTQMTKNE
jgi:hypothetical protein